jgi:hypothetical protein
MGDQQPDPDQHDRDNPDAWGESGGMLPGTVYHSDTLHLRALTVAQTRALVERLLADGAPARLVGQHATPELAPPPARTGPAGLFTGGTFGVPGRSARASYRRQRAAELAGWLPSLPWRLAAVAGAGVGGQVLAGGLGLPGAAQALLVGAAAAVAAVRLRFRVSADTAAWRRGAAGERKTARQLRRLHRHGYVSFHDVAVPGSRTNIDHLVVGPTGLFVVDSKQYRGRVHQTPDGLVWHDHYPMTGIIQTVRWEADQVSQALAVGVPVTPLLCVHGATVAWDGLIAGGVAVVPARRLRSALGADHLLAPADVATLAAQVQANLHQAG